MQLLAHGRHRGADGQAWRMPFALDIIDLTHPDTLSHQPSLTDQATETKPPGRTSSTGRTFPDAAPAGEPTADGYACGFSLRAGAKDERMSGPDPRRGSAGDRVRIEPG